MNEFDKYIITNFCGGELLAHMQSLMEQKEELSPEEAMFLVHKCHFVPIGKKHEAYQKMIDRYAGHFVTIYGNLTYGRTVAEHLNSYMQQENELIKQLADDREGNAVYFACQLLDWNGYVTEWQCDLGDGLVPCRTYKECLESCPRRGLPISLAGRKIPKDLAMVKIYKMSFNTANALVAEVSKSGEIIKIYNRGGAPFALLNIDLGIPSQEIDEPSD